MRQHRRLQTGESQREEPGGHSKEFPGIKKDQQAQRQRDRNHHDARPKRQTLEVLRPLLPERAIKPPPILGRAVRRRDALGFGQEKNRQGCPELHQRWMLVVELEVPEGPIVIARRNMDELVVVSVLREIAATWLAPSA